MSDEELIAQVMKLPKDQRLKIADMIYDSVDEVDVGYDADWAAEIKRRVDEHRVGTRQAISSEEAHRIIRGQGNEAGVTRDSMV